MGWVEDLIWNFIIPQGTIDARFSLDVGIKKTVQGGKGELFLNATDLLNTMVIRKTITGNNFGYTSTDYYETQFILIRCVITLSQGEKA